MDIAITGSSGLIGTALREAMAAAGHRVVRVVRSQSGTVAGDSILWDPPEGTIDAAGLEGVDAVVHLAGAGIGDHRWTAAYKRELRDSRLQGTGLIARTLPRLQRPPAVLVSASGIDYYGDRGDEELTEKSTPGEGFLAELCQAWEAATAPAEAAGIRVAYLRNGMVLGREASALRRQLPLFKLGLGGRFGSGRQWQSWIHLDDEIAAIRHLIDGDHRGPTNLTAPNPVRNSDFARTLGTVLRRPSIMPVPKFGPRLVLGRDLADTLLFESKRVLPAALLADGFTFTHPELEGALRDLLG